MPKKTKETNSEKNIPEKKVVKASTKKENVKTSKSSKATTTKKTTTSNKAASNTKITKTNKKLPLPTSEKALKTNKTKETRIIKTSENKIAKTNSKNSKSLTLIDKLKSMFSVAERSREASLEYYDLPYNYKETIVKILAQTPKKLFVYWDVSLKDIENYRKIFGDDFFNTTYPVLIIHNEDKNYSFEIPVNDFANSWYIDIDDPKCKYSIDFGRKFKKEVKIINSKTFEDEKINLQNDYLFISNSNKIESPNDHVLFEKYNASSSIKYKNIKTNEISNKKIKDLPISQIFMNEKPDSNIESIYNEIYKLNGLPMETFFDLNNPSSGNPSSRI